MSLRAEIRKITYELLEKTGSCTIADIKKELEGKGIQLEPRNTAIRVTLSNLAKKDGNIQRSGRGSYIYAKDEQPLEENKYLNNKVEEDITMEIEKFEQEITNIIKEAGHFDWINESDEAVNNMRKKIKKIKQLHQAIEKAFIKSGFSVK